MSRQTCSLAKIAKLDEKLATLRTRMYDLIDEYVAEGMDIAAATERVLTEEPYSEYYESAWQFERLKAVIMSEAEPDPSPPVSERGGEVFIAESY